MTNESRRGASLLELVIVLGVACLLLGFLLPSVRGLADRLAVRGAAADAMAAFATARHLAIRNGALAAVLIDERGAALRLLVRGDTTVRPLGAVHGVRVEATRDSMAYTPLGLGYGGANLRLILSRGRAAESIYVSRLGRVRR